jgi:hypothetical protein
MLHETYYLAMGYVALIAHTRNLSHCCVFHYFLFRNGDSKVDGKRARIQQPNTEGILGVEFASYYCSFSTLNSLVSTTIMEASVFLSSMIFITWLEYSVFVFEVYSNFFLKNTPGFLLHMGWVNMVTMETWVYSVFAVCDCLFLERPIKSWLLFV